MLYEAVFGEGPASSRSMAKVMSSVSVSGLPPSTWITRQSRTGPWHR